ncbi:3862_t:CDS:2, partial [Diversispora eburnea]
MTLETAKQLLELQGVFGNSNSNNITNEIAISDMPNIYSTMFLIHSSNDFGYCNFRNKINLNGI